MAGADEQKDIALKGGFWYAADQIDPLIAYGLVDRATPYTGTAAAICTVNSADLNVQPVQTTNVKVVRKFLREAGVPEGLLDGIWDGLRGFIHGRHDYCR